MKWGIETRLPFLDYRLVEMSLNLPIELKLNNGWTKFILRKLMDKKLPDEIVWRKNKIGFEAPQNIVDNNIDYFATLVSKSTLLNTIFAQPINIKQIGNKQLVWRLISIANWENVYNVTLN
jgi:asparagine synthase (glutamine-hydrolysing)